jgi:hypothetical protein
MCRQLAEEGEGASTRRERAVLGLQEVLSLRSRELLSYLVPRLLAHPITAPHARALNAIAQVFGRQHSVKWLLHAPRVCVGCSSEVCAFVRTCACALAPLTPRVLLALWTHVCCATLQVPTAALHLHLGQIIPALVAELASAEHK